MKKLLVGLLLLAAVLGCGTSYMLLRMPDNIVTKKIVEYCQAQPGEAAPAAPAEAEASGESEPAPAVEPAPAPTPAPAEAKPDPDEGKPWKCLRKECWYSGKKLSESDLKKKVVLVYVWDVNVRESIRQLQEMQKIWNSFKGDQFLVIGSHRGGKNDKVGKVVNTLKLSFPMYEGAAYEKEPLNLQSRPYLYVVDHTGKVRYRGQDDKQATVAITDAITAVRLAK